jgi:hypothetical protein
MEHKAYTFDWSSFEGELAPALYAALKSCDLNHLVAFIAAQRHRLTDPNEGDPLPEDWPALVAS